MAAPTVVEMFVNIVVALLAKVLTDPTMTRKISVTIRPYSTAVAPDWQARKALRPDRATTRPAARRPAASGSP